MLAVVIILALVAVGFGTYQFLEAMKMRKEVKASAEALDKKWEVLKYLYELKDVKSDYKIAIMEKLNLGIITMKKIVEQLKDHELITDSTDQIFLTKFGEKFIETFGKNKWGL